MGCFFFKSKSAFRQRLNFVGNVWAESTWFIPRLSLLAPRLYRCLPAPHSLGGVNSPPGQQQAGPWPYLGISAGPGNPARMDSPSSLKNRWRARTAPTSPHRKPGSTGWSTLWKKKKRGKNLIFWARWYSDPSTARTVPAAVAVSFPPLVPGRFSLRRDRWLGSSSLHSKEYSLRKIWL